MNTRRSTNALRLLIAVVSLLPAAAIAAEDNVDLATIHRIKEEAFKDSKVMDHLFYLTDVNGPRLTNSPGQRAAADWAVTSLKAWGKFGRGWSLSRFTMSLRDPAYAPLPGVPLAWSSGTKGMVSGGVVFAPLFTAQELERREDGDPTKLAAHLDSWHSGTGATDNAAGSAIVLEAMRILKTLGLPMDRTVRLALWTGEEQGIYGSRGYVKNHFADPVTMQTLPEHAKLAAYFNVDNGTGKIRGVYLQGNDMMRPVFAAWLSPFDAVGLPGFQFIQDPLDYFSRTHHSNIDVYDHVQAGDLMQASAILASFVYNAATRPELLPRKPLPSPLPPKGAE